MLPRLTLLAVLALAAMLGAVMGLGIVRSRLADLRLTGGQSITQRVEIWRDSLHMIRRQPWGVGAGGYAERYPEYKQTVDRFSARHAHNEPLELVAELGWIAVILLVAFGVGFVRSSRPARAGPLADSGVLHLAVVTATGVFLLHSLVDFPLRLPANLLVFSILLGAGTACRPVVDGESRRGMASGRGPRWLGPAAGLLLACGWLYVAIWARHWEQGVEWLERREHVRAAHARCRQPSSNAAPACMGTRLCAVFSVWAARTC
jgi:hypothetical protein